MEDGQLLLTEHVPADSGFVSPFPSLPRHTSLTCTGIAQRFGHKKKNHMSWLVSMATRLQICPAVISPMDRLEVDRCIILL